KRRTLLHQPKTRGGSPLQVGGPHLPTERSLNQMSTPSPLGPAPSLESVRDGNALLQFGHRGDAVAHIQFLVGVFDDGGFGENTRAAITAFQEAQNIAVSEEDKGKVGASTLAALEAATKAILDSLAKIDKRNKRIHLHPELRKKLAILADHLEARG